MLETSSLQCLPRQIDPRKFAQQGIGISGRVSLGDMQRLSDILPSSEGNIVADLLFGKTEQGLLTLSGSIKASVQNVCQRCLGNVAVDLDCSLNLAIIWSEDDATRIPKSVDPWIVGEGATDIYQVIEDELLLSLPIVSYHSEECVPAAYFSSVDDQVEAVVHKSESPFKVLESLKGQLDTGKDSVKE